VSFTGLGSAVDEMVRALEAKHPRWQIWVVHHVIGAPVWCARRRSDEGPALNQWLAEDLSAAIDRAEAT
jgi:hypothetical protein